MNDDKSARDYNIEGGSVLHLVRMACPEGLRSCHAIGMGLTMQRLCMQVLALRGGATCIAC